MANDDDFDADDLSDDTPPARTSWLTITLNCRSRSARLCGAALALELTLLGTS